jgi:acetolactate synthase small subunit
MNPAMHHCLRLEILNAPSVLPRILLVCARRRLAPRELNLLDDGTGRARVELHLDCTARMAMQLSRQLARIVEVVAVD